MTIPKPRSEASLSHSDESVAYCNEIAFHRRSIRDIFIALITALTLIFVISACTNDLGQLMKGRRMQDVDPRKRLSARFSAHNFGPYCFDTLECRIEYEGRAWLNETTRSAAIDDRQKANLTGSIVGIENFPGPAVITWRSLDGRGHKAAVDIAEIFSDERIVHSHELDVRDVPKDAAFVEPEIIIVVDDFTISVYMKAFIPLMHPKTGDAAKGNHRYEPILVWTQTF